MTVKSFYICFLSFFACLMAIPARAEPMAFPVVCDAGSSCFIIGYPDMEGAPDKAQDYACGPATSEGNRFLEIGLPDTAVATTGVYVIAAADGKVAEVSDGYVDLAVSSKLQIKRGTPVCGNGVIIDHGRGLRTGYCHMKQGSITVKKGDFVNKGRVLGHVGQSGVALWPQLGFSIQQGGFTLDPITGGSPAEGCGYKPKPMVALPGIFASYQPVSVVGLGFSLAPQKAERIARGTPDRLAQMNPESQMLNFWGLILGIKKGDHIETRLRDPRGRTFQYQDIEADTDKDRQLVNVTRRRGHAPWREGLYTGEIVVTRTIKGKDYVAKRTVTLLVRAE